jgi:tetratricopeptide (TPR) repeat protein
MKVFFKFSIFLLSCFVIIACSKKEDSLSSSKNSQASWDRIVTIFVSQAGTGDWAKCVATFSRVQAAFANDPSVTQEQKANLEAVMQLFGDYRRKKLASGFPDEVLQAQIRGWIPYVNSSPVEQVAKIYGGCNAMAENAFIQANRNDSTNSSAARVSESKEAAREPISPPANSSASPATADENKTVTQEAQKKSNSDQQDKFIVKECDKFAGSPMDPQKTVAGISYDKLDATVAIPTCKQATEADPNNARVWFQLGRAYEKQGNNDQAISAYQKAAQLGSAAAYNNIGELYRQGKGFPKNKDKAAEYFQKSAQMGSDEGKDNLAKLSSRN